MAEAGIEPVGPAPGDDEFSRILRETGGQEWGSASAWERGQRIGRAVAQADAQRRRN